MFLALTSNFNAVLVCVCAAFLGMQRVCVQAVSILRPECPLFPSAVPSGGRQDRRPSDQPAGQGGSMACFNFD